MIQPIRSASVRATSLPPPSTLAVMTLSRSSVSGFATALLVVGALSACGDIDTVDLGDFRCVSSPCEANFGQLVVNRPGQSAKVIVTNIGKGDLDIRAIRLEDTSSQIRFSSTTEIFIGEETDFEWLPNDAGHAFTGDGVITLAMDERLEIEVAFSPQGDDHGCAQVPNSAGIIHCGDIVIVSNDVNADEATIRAPILLSVGDSRMEVSPTTIAFAPAQLLSGGSDSWASQERSFTVSNLGTGNMTLQNIQSSTVELTVEDASGASLPITIAGGLEREFVVTWRPTSAEPLEAQLTLNSNASSGASRVIFVSSDGGDEAGIEIEPCEFDFGEAPVGETTEILFDVTNTGTAPLTWNVTVSDVIPSDALGDFDIVTPLDEPALGNQPSLPADQTRTLKLAYSPTEARNVTANLGVRGNFGSPFGCPITAGEPVPLMDVVPTQLTWGGVEPGETETRSFFVYNVGRADLEVAGISKSGDLSNEWVVDALSVDGFTVAPGGVHQVEVVYTRQAEDLPASDAATLTLTGNADSAQVFLSANHGEIYLPPTCDIDVDPAPPYTVSGSITLDASGSELNGGEWSANPFRWALVRPDGSTATLATTTGTTTSLTFDVAGTWAVTLIGTANVETERVSCELTQTFAVTE